MTYEAIATDIRQVALENRLKLSCDASSVGKWLNGVVPKPETMAAAVEAFARRLNRPDLTAADLGWEQDPPGHRDPWIGDPVAQVAVLGRDDMLNRRTLLTAGTYSLAAAALPPASRPTTLHRAGPAARAGAGDVARIRHMTGLFHQMDDHYGGGHARNAVAAYLTQEVAPLLRGTTGAARPDLFTAAAELAYLLGWMASDDLQTGLSQRYYIQAFRLAEEADNPVKCATVLRSLSVQAVELGHGRQGLELAEAASSMLGTRAPLRTRAWVTGMRAEAVAAADNNRGRAVRLLAEAETHLDKADSRPRDEWTGNYQRSSYEHQIGLTMAELGNWAKAEHHFQASMEARDPAERRTLTLVGVRLAHAQLQQRHPEQAAHTLLELRENLAGVSSGRVRNQLKDIRASWQPYRTEEKVCEADELLRGLLQSTKSK